jgi:hypothetical protein
LWEDFGDEPQFVLVSQVIERHEVFNSNRREGLLHLHRGLTNGRQHRFKFIAEQAHFLAEIRYVLPVHIGFIFEPRN